ELEPNFMGPLRAPQNMLTVYGEHSSPNLVLSGHGGWNPRNGTITIEHGTSLTVYSEHGASISNNLGMLIETAGDTSKVFKRTFLPGDVAPNYTLLPPKDLTLAGGATVRADTLLSEMMTANMGHVQWAACTSVNKSAAQTLLYDVNAVFDTKGYSSTYSQFWTLVKEYGKD
ncbi:MAG: putative adhesin, partial [Telluria sp.]